MRGTLTKLHNGSALRTDKVVGEAKEPVIGKPFILFAQPLDPEADIRVISTSPVDSFEITPPQRMGATDAFSLEKWIIKTANSTYMFVEGDTNTL